MTFERDLQNWVNRLRWKHFYSKPQITNKEFDENVMKLERKLVKKTEVQNAPKSKSNALELFIDLVSQGAHEYKSKRKHTVPDNLEPEARKALNELKNLYKNKDIVVRLFDKGVGFFLLHKEEYVDRNHRPIQDL